MDAATVNYRRLVSLAVIYQGEFQSVCGVFQPYLKCQQ